MQIWRIFFHLFEFISSKLCSVLGKLRSLTIKSFWNHFIAKLKLVAGNLWQKEWSHHISKQSFSESQWCTKNEQCPRNISFCVYKLFWCLQGMRIRQLRGICFQFNYDFILAPKGLKAFNFCIETNQNRTYVTNVIKILFYRSFELRKIE